MNTRSLAAHLRRKLRHFTCAREGNVAIIFALSALPVIGLMGAAVDYSRANSAKAKLDALADAAALSAANKVAMGMTAAEAKKTAETLFKTQSLEVSNVTVGTYSAQVTDSGLNRSVVFSYEANVPTTILGIAGKTNVPIGGVASAIGATPTYIDFHLLLDNTPSMGVAATPNDVSKMVNNTSDKCAFACHEENKQNDYYRLAKKLNVTMRIDVLRTATQRLMDTAVSVRLNNEQFRMATHTFGASCTKLGLTTITPLTKDLAKAKAEATAIDLMTIPEQGYFNDQCTNFDQTLTAANGAIEKPGTGESSSSPQKILFFVSDGVADAYNPSSCSRPIHNKTRCQEPLDTSYCETIKKRGIKIAVLYTTYLPLPTNSWYNTWIAPFSSNIGPNMKKCASDGLYFEVSPTEGIADAMVALFQKVVSQARLTN